MSVSIRADEADPFREQAVQATALLIELLDSRMRGQFQTAEHALDDLKRIGIEVRFRPASSARKAVRDGA